jgi:glyceraldehyde 3-phosphate dehydrogenase
MRLGLHGLGRIGRALLRCSRGSATPVAAINDVVDDDNLVYLTRFDSIYGRFPEPLDARPGSWSVGGRRVARFRRDSVCAVPWAQAGVDVVIDASGSTTTAQCRQLLAGGGVRAVILTRAEPDADAAIVAGVNDGLLTDDVRLISASTCDANAAALVLSALCPTPPASGSVVTLHPWLEYQNVLDGPTTGFPSARQDDYGLGRAATENLIPKQTSLLGALEQVLPGSAQSLIAMSFRVPTPSVSCIHATIEFEDRLSVGAVTTRLARAAAGRMRGCLAVSDDARVSTDFRGCDLGATVDRRWLEVTGSGAVRVVAWYDNELGYAGQVLRVASALAARDSAQRGQRSRVGAHAGPSW